MSLPRPTKSQLEAIVWLSPDNWPEPWRTEEINRQYANERRREAAIKAHTHDFDYVTRLCRRCGTCELAHEANSGSGRLGLLCVPDLVLEPTDGKTRAERGER